VSDSREPLDVVVPAGSDDLDGLLPVCLRQLHRHVRPLGRVHVVTPCARSARAALAAAAPDLLRSVRVVEDGDVCPEAAALPPWFRQQYLKLHVDRVGAGPRVLVVGADTVVLDPVDLSDLLDDRGRPLVRFFRYPRPNEHLAFERARVRRVAGLLGVVPARTLVMGDFVCDLFLFDVAVLRDLRTRLAARGGLLAHVSTLGAREGHDNRFGEWTAYAVHALEAFEDAASARLAEPGFFGQVHSASDLARPDRYAARVVHLAWKPGAQAFLDGLRGSGRLAAEGA
jgi:hypothetical protein